VLVKPTTVLLSEPGSTTLLMVTQSFLSAHPAIPPAPTTPTWPASKSA
jgi:hypothetical protein